MKKKVISACIGTLAVLAIVFCGVVYAKNENYSLKKFYNEAGEAVYFPVADEEKTNLQVQYKKSNAPEKGKIGDVFRSEIGLERVIAVSEDGAFVTEIIDR